MRLELVIQLLSDATFGAGSLAPGEVDDEVEHDDDGMPMLGARRIEGLLREQWLAMAPYYPEFATEAAELLGAEGNNAPGGGRLLELWSATVPDDVAQWIRYARRRKAYAVDATAVFRAATAIRASHARDRTTQGPATGALRRSRVVVRGTRLVAPMALRPPAGTRHLELLKLVASGVRHAGQGRNRGRGHIACAIAERTTGEGVAR